jgi:putative peptidoglycan lipid II flippase
MMHVGAAAILITGMSLFSKGLGIIREAVFAAKFGTTAEMDAFVLAFLLVEAIGAYFITDLAAVYIPEYSRLTVGGDNAAAQAFNRSLLVLVGLASIVVSTLVLIFAEPFVRLAAPGFSPAAFNVTVDLIRFMTPTIVFSGLMGYFMAVQEAQKQFRYSSSIHIVNNVVTIAVVWFGAYWFGVYAAALAAVLAALAKMMIQWPGLRSCRFRFGLTMDLLHPSVRRMGVAFLPVALSTSVVYLDLFITRYLASGLPVGSISVLSYSSKIESVSVALLVTPLVTASFPSLAAAAAIQDKADFVRLFQRCFQLINLVMLPMIAFLWFLRGPVIAFLFQRGAFVADDTANTARVVGFLLPAILAVAWQMFLAKALYSLQKFKVFVAGILLFSGLDILLNFWWIDDYGLLGVASARSVALWVSVLLMLIYVYRGLPGLGNGDLLFSLGRVGVAAAVFGLLADTVYALVPLSLFLRLSIAFLTGSLGYLIVLRGLRAPEFALLWELRRQLPGLSKRWPEKNQ